jgi:hypothetical protein
MLRGWKSPVGKEPLKTVIVARSGNLSVGNHMADMRAWLAEQSIEAHGHARWDAGNAGFLGGM